MNSTSNLEQQCEYVLVVKDWLHLEVYTFKNDK